MNESDAKMEMRIATKEAEKAASCFVVVRSKSILVPVSPVSICQ